jgi:hypothetical protein
LLAFVIQCKSVYLISFSAAELHGAVADLEIFTH